MAWLLLSFFQLDSFSHSSFSLELGRLIQFFLPHFWCYGLSGCTTRMVKKQPCKKKGVEWEPGLHPSHLLISVTRNQNTFITNLVTKSISQNFLHKQHIVIFSHLCAPDEWDWSGHQACGQWLNRGDLGKKIKVAQGKQGWCNGTQIQSGPVREYFTGRKML